MLDNLGMNQTLMRAPKFEQKVGSVLRQSPLFTDKDRGPLFQTWSGWLKKRKSDLNDKTILSMWQSEGQADLSLFFKLGGLKEDSMSVEEWIIKIIDELICINCIHRTNEEGFAVFEKIKSQEIQLKTVLNFEPQVTIQYPIEYSVFLWSCLFKGDKDGPIFSKIRTVVSLFGREDFFDKKSGLAFLHALTLSCMTPNSMEDSQLLNESIERAHKGQVDAKGCLYLMSRRPFSKIWQDVNSKTP
ncbi:MAG: hypothetical protein A2007_00425 [Verrucomicrobia bacterium GWC2_42_7]|nr:MAG: hypothetical protein A2007_00425 [Verrucomicrobia bacterium GWC2_42_7]